MDFAAEKERIQKEAQEAADYLKRLDEEHKNAEARLHQLVGQLQLVNKGLEEEAKENKKTDDE